MSRFGQDIQDFRPAWKLIREDFHRIEMEQFQTEGSRSGRPWAPLRPSYAEWKARWYPGRKVLVATGEMQRQMTTGQGMVIQMEPKTLRLSPTIRRAMYHQGGTRSMVARPVVSLTEADKTRWMKILQQFVHEASKKAGLTR
jgi:hypothetical protein